MDRYARLLCYSYFGFYIKHVKILYYIIYTNKSSVGNTKY